VSAIDVARPPLVRRGCCKFVSLNNR
jgi:hypothetical protein